MAPHSRAVCGGDSLPSHKFPGQRTKVAADHLLMVLEASTTDIVLTTLHGRDFESKEHSNSVNSYLGSPR